MYIKFKKLLKHDVFITYFANIFTVLSGIVYILLVTNYASVETYGILTIIISSSGILVNVFSVRTSEAIVRFIKSEKVLNRKENIKMLLMMGLLFDLFLGLSIVLVFYLLSTFIATKFINNIDFSFDVWLYSFISMFTFMRGTSSGYFQLREKFVFMNIMNILENILKIIFLVAVFFVLKDGSIFNIILSQIVSVSFITIVYYFFLFKEYKKNYSCEVFNIDKLLFKEYLSFTAKTFISSLLKVGNQKVDTLILAYFVDNKTIGIYEIVKKIVTVPINFISTPFSVLYYPKLVSAFSLKNINDIKDIILKITLYLMLSSGLLFLVGYIYFDIALKFFNVEFQQQYLLWFVLIFIYSIPIEWWSRIFSNATNPMYSIYSNLFVFWYFFTIVIYVNNNFGINGFLYSMVILKLVIVILWLSFLKKEIKYIKR